MKTTLTSADPSGWYGVRRSFEKETSDVGYWNGKVLRTYFVHDYVVTGRMYTESDVAALNEELRTLREELATNKHSLDVCGKYAESMQRSSEDYLNELRKEREENATLQNQADSLLKQAEQLEAELARLKSQPYEMRRADKPDCLGIWFTQNGEAYWLHTSERLDNVYSVGPFYYYGPIPVIPKEQQPPRVVTIREKQTGKESLAIPQMRDGTPEYYFLLLADGTVSGERVWCNNWEAAQ